ncbi:MAG: isoprenylcysteine carboxylmethyltransferase family protein [candidate division NC10 bacterium]|nr:isoprenylcysteine carboxylmethyltransferase family protein [candidate division NC10 bacterium]
MHGENIPYGYGFWSLVVFNAAFFVIFVLSFLTPLQRREWRSFGMYSAFIVPLFTEMYGFPLTIYILTSILGSRYPVLNPFTHASGHLWVTLLGGGATLMTAIHVVSNALMFGGLLIIARGWRLVHRAQGALVTDGLYRWVRHPQYSGLFLITIGLLIQWPTIVTALTWPILLAMYIRLARREEADMEAQFGDAYRAYVARVPRFVPRLRPGRSSGVSSFAGEVAGPRPNWSMNPKVPRE